MAGLLSKGIKISYNSGSAGSAVWTELTGLQSIPDLGGAADKVDVTTLADGNYKYINGIKDFGDLEFSFLYDASTSASNYQIIRGLEEDGEIVEFKVEFPDAITSGSTGHGTQFDFSGQVSTSIDGQEVNSAITFKMNVTLNSDIEVTMPV